MIELDYDKVKFITLYTGTKGYHNCYCKCPCCTQKNINDNYQGQIEQIEELFNKFKEFSKANPNVTYEQFIKSEMK